MSEPMTVVFVMRESFWAGGRSVWAYDLREHDKVCGNGMSLGVAGYMLPEGVELGDGALVKVTVELLQDQPAGKNPYRCDECQSPYGHRPTCSQLPPGARGVEERTS